MIALFIGSAMLAQTAPEGIPFAERGPDIQAKVSARLATARDDGERQAMDPRVTYFKDYSVRVKLPTRTVTLRREGAFGQLVVSEIAPDGSIQYHSDDWYSYSSYIWADGKSTRISQPGHERTTIMSYRDRKNYVYETTRQMGPKGMRVSGTELYRVADGVTYKLGPGTFVEEPTPGVVVAYAELKANGEAAGQDEVERVAYRVYRDKAFYDLPGSEYVGITSSGIAITTRPVLGPDTAVMHFEARRGRLVRSQGIDGPAITTVIWSTDGKVQRQVNVPGYVRAVNAAGEILGANPEGKQGHFWTLTGGKMRQVKCTLPKGYRFGSLAFSGMGTATFNNKGEITVRGENRQGRDVVLTLGRK